MHDSDFSPVVNLEQDLFNCKWLKEKVKSSDTYAQNLYAALCSVVWCKQSFVAVLAGSNSWHITWRGADSIVSSLREDGSSWYCSGIEFTDELDNNSFVPEGTITMEIMEDLAKLKWTGKTYEP